MPSLSSRAALAILAALTASALAASCGTRAARPQEPDNAPLGALFPASANPLRDARALEMIPEAAIAVLLAPDLRGLASQLDTTAGLPADVRTGIGRFTGDVLGYDILDLNAARALGVATDAPVALSLLDLDMAAVVLPLADRQQFNSSWQEAPQTVVIVRQTHAIVVFPIGAEFSATRQIVRELRVSTRSLSFAGHAGVRRAAAALRYGGRLLLLVNPAATYRHGRHHVREQRDLLDLTTARDMVEIARFQDDREALELALVELVQEQRKEARLRTAQAFLDSSLAVLDGLAISVGWDDAAIKIHGAAPLTRGNHNVHITRALPARRSAPGAGGTELSTRMATALIVPLLEQLLERPVYRKLRDLEAAHGGHNSLDDALHIAYGRDREPWLVRIGLREPARTRELLDSRRNVRGWRMDVRGSELVVERLAGRGSGPASPPRTPAAQTIAHATDSASRLFFDIRTALPLLTGYDNPREPPDEPWTEREREQQRLHKRLRYQRAQTSARIATELRESGRELATGMDIGSASVRREGETLYLHAIQPLNLEKRATIVRHLAQLWYRRSAYSSNGARLAAIDQQLTELETQLNRGVLTLLTGTDVIPLPNVSGIGRTAPGSHRGGIVTGQPLKSGLATGLTPIGRPATQQRVTASATEVSSGGTIDRTTIDQSLLGIVPHLRRCHSRLREDRNTAHGYVTATVEIRANAVHKVSVRAANDAHQLGDTDFLQCIRETLARMRLTGHGSARLALWFGQAQ